jgi:hypothetical protein
MSSSGSYSITSVGYPRKESRCGPTGIRSTLPRKPTASLLRLWSQLEALIQATLALRRPLQPHAPVMGKDYPRVWSRFRHPRLQNGAETPRELSRQDGCMATLIRAFRSPASGRLGTRAAEDAWEAGMVLAGAHGRGARGSPGGRCLAMVDNGRLSKTLSQ